MSDWYFIEGEHESGPYTAIKMIELAGSGKMNMATQLRREDMLQCITAEKVKELKAAILQYEFSQINIPTEKIGTESENETMPGRDAVSSPDSEQGSQTVLTITENIAQKVTDMAGVEKIEGFSPKELFSEVFKKHGAEEVEEYFTVGVPSTTPDIANVDTAWPRPWVFFRTFIAAAFIFVGLYQILSTYENIVVLPGVIMMGSFVVPVAALIFFVEMNARRNVSLYQVLRLGFAGGVLAMGITMFMSQMLNLYPDDWMIPIIAGPVEEVAKLLALVLVVFNLKYRYILNGLLFGTAVGTGFAAFESAGYAFAVLIQDDVDAMLGNILLRGMLSPFGHIIWTGICAAALWKVKGDKPFKFEMLQDWRFVRVFLIAVVLHMAWNMPFQLPFLAYRLALGAVAWIIALAFIQDGLKQLRAEKLAALDEAVGSETTADPM